MLGLHTSRARSFSQKASSQCADPKAAGCAGCSAGQQSGILFLQISLSLCQPVSLIQLSAFYFYLHSLLLLLIIIILLFLPFFQLGRLLSTSAHMHGAHQCAMCPACIVLSRPQSLSSGCIRSKAQTASSAQFQMIDSAIQLARCSGQWVAICASSRLVVDVPFKLRAK